MTCSARSFLFLPFLTFGPVEPLDVALVEHGRPRADLLELGTDLLEQRRLDDAGRASPRRSSRPRRCPSRRTRDRRACASGMTSLIFGERPSVRLPRRTVPICVSEPIGLARPLRMASTPAIVVVLTAPRPTSRIPSFPRVGTISTGVDTSRKLYHWVILTGADVPEPVHSGSGGDPYALIVGMTGVKTGRPHRADWMRARRPAWRRRGESRTLGPRRRRRARPGIGRACAERRARRRRARRSRDRAPDVAFRSTRTRSTSRSSTTRAAFSATMRAETRVLAVPRVAARSAPGRPRDGGRRRAARRHSARSSHARRADRRSTPRRRSRPTASARCAISRNAKV